jgi:hypothetical protein
MPLIAAAVSELDLTHAVGGNANVTFPKAALAFQQSAQPQPLSKTTPVDAGLTVVWLGSNPRKLEWETVNGSRQQMAYAITSWMFYVRAEVIAANPGATPGANAQERCRTTAARLVAVMRNSKAAFPLSQKGIMHLRPDDPRVISEDSRYIVRLVRCRGTLRYPVLSQ